MEKEKKFLLVGQRWDLDLPRKIDFSNDWQGKLRKELADRGRRHPAGGSDYFIFPRTCFEKSLILRSDVPVGIIGCFIEARKQGWKLIDCTKAIDIIHQDHDYAHLPNGQSHYRLPESNIMWN